MIRITLDIKLIILPSTTPSTTTPSISISWQIAAAVVEYPVVEERGGVCCSIDSTTLVATILSPVGRPEYSSKIHPSHHDKLYDVIVWV